MKWPSREGRRWAAEPAAAALAGGVSLELAMRTGNIAPNRAALVCLGARVRRVGNSRGEVVPAGADPARDRAAGLSVLPADLAGAGERRGGHAARPGRPGLDRPAPAGDADSGPADPDDAGVLRPAALLRGDGRALAGPAVPCRRAPRGGGAPGLLRRDLRPPVVGVHPHRRLPDALSGLAVRLP